MFSRLRQVLLTFRRGVCIDSQTVKLPDSRHLCLPLPVHSYHTSYTLMHAMKAAVYQEQEGNLRVIADSSFTVLKENNPLTNSD